MVRPAPPQKRKTMNTLSRLSNNQSEYEAATREAMNELRARIADAPICLRWIVRRRERRTLARLNEQLSMLRSRYWMIKEETRRIIYHA